MYIFLSRNLRYFPEIIIYQLFKRQRLVINNNAFYHNRRMIKTILAFVNGQGIVLPEEKPQPLTDIFQFDAMILPDFPQLLLEQRNASFPSSIVMATRMNDSF